MNFKIRHSMYSVLTLHVEVAMEIWWPISIEQSHSAVCDFLISVHHPIMLIITVCILEQYTTESMYFYCI